MFVTLKNTHVNNRQKQDGVGGQKTNCATNLDTSGVLYGVATVYKHDVKFICIVYFFWHFDNYFL